MGGYRLCIYYMTMKILRQIKFKTTEKTEN